MRWRLEGRESARERGREREKGAKDTKRCIMVLPSISYGDTKTNAKVLMLQILYSHLNAAVKSLRLNAETIPYILSLVLLNIHSILFDLKENVVSL